MSRQLQVIKKLKIDGVVIACKRNSLPESPLSPLPAIWTSQAYEVQKGLPYRLGSLIFLRLHYSRGCFTGQRWTKKGRKPCIYWVLRPSVDCFGLSSGGEEEDRTPDLRIANAALSQLSYPPDAANYSFRDAMQEVLRSARRGVAAGWAAGVRRASRAGRRRCWPGRRAGRAGGRG